MKIQLQKKSAKPAKTAIYFTRTAGKKDKPSLKFSCENNDIKKLIEESFKAGEYKSAADEVTVFRKQSLSDNENIVFVSLGDEKSINSQSFRQAAGSVYKFLKSQRLFQATVKTESFDFFKDAQKATYAFAEGLQLADYELNTFKSNNKKDKSEEFSFTVEPSKSAKEAALKKAIEQAEITAECINFSRMLGDTPGNFMTPSILAKETQKAAQNVTNLKVTVWDKARIKKEKMGGLLGVSLGSGQDPRFIIMEYNGAPKSKKPVCFVGKGLTFDAGGISIKPAANMDEMRYDMCGGANVIGSVLAMAKLKLKVNVIALIPSTENMLGENANKPGDILVARNGKSIEVLNTDAEGRLILADALSYASEKKPAAIFDAATLTGAMVIALGNVHTGFFTRDEKLRSKISKSAEEADELLWPMPITDFHSADMKGAFADLSNIASNRGAGSSTAAAFLENFVEEGIPWAHFDIAGTAWNQGQRYSYLPAKGATGSVIRTFIELAKNY